MHSTAVLQETSSADKDVLCVICHASDLMRHDLRCKVSLATDMCDRNALQRTYLPHREDHIMTPIEQHRLVDLHWIWGCNLGAQLCKKIVSSQG